MYNSIIEMIVIIIEVAFVIGFFILEIKKAENEDKKYIIASYKTVMYTVVAIFTAVGHICSEYEDVYLTSAIVTVSLIEAIDNGMQVRKWKTLNSKKSNK